MSYYFTKSEVKAAARTSVSNSRYYSASSVLDSAKASVVKSYDKFDVFLSHSVKDAEIVLGVKSLLEKQGLKVYVDWTVDKAMSRDNVSVETAEVLRARMAQSKSLIFIATENASTSKWMPWELGYFDGLSSGAVSIMPIMEFAHSHFEGQEYLGLYPVVSKDKYMNTNQEDIFVKKKSKGWQDIREFGRGSKVWRSYG